MTGMHPLTMASNNLADDGVSPAGLKQKIDLMTRGVNQIYDKETKLNQKAEQKYKRFYLRIPF